MAKFSYKHLSILPQGFGTMYHVSPRRNRESILEHGLQGAENRSRTPWTELNRSHEQPAGNYFFDNPEDAHDYVYQMHKGPWAEERYPEEDWEWPAMPEGYASWSPEQQREHDDHVEPIRPQEDPQGYDIYRVQAHGLPMMPDPETQLIEQSQKHWGEKPHYWDIGKIHDLDEGGSLGDFGEEARRYVAPLNIHPSRIQLHEHFPSWNLSQDDMLERAENEYDHQYPKPWGAIPFTERPIPGHESAVKTADKLHDFLMNPKSRPDLQTPEAQGFLKQLEFFHNEKTDPLTPWLTREWKKGRIVSEPGGRTGLKWQLPVRQYMDETDNPQYQQMVRDVNDPRWDEFPAEPDVTQRDLNHMGDFLNSNHALKREMGDIMQHKAPEFKQRIHNWDQAMEAEAKEEAAQGGEVVHSWPDGWSVRRLHTPEELKGEGDAMGHCVGGYTGHVEQGHSSIYSLRDPQGIPHVTTEIKPKYVVDEAGHRHEKEDLSGPFNSHEMSPEGGSLVQIQGKANRDPNPEYKERMKDWFDTFEKKPEREESGEELYSPHHVGPEDIKPIDQTAEDEYGLPQEPTRVDWENMMNEFKEEPRHREYNLYHEDAQKVYDLAKIRGEIPELAHEFRNFREETQNDLQTQQEHNYDWWYDNVGPDPEIREEEIGQMTPEERQERAEGSDYGGPSFGYEPNWYHNEYEHPWDQKKQDEAMKEYEDRERQQWKELEREHYGSQHVDSFEKLLKPHENTRTGEYTNEPYDPQKDPGSITYQPSLFSSWRI